MNLVAVVLTLNEERNVPDCLASLAWADRQVVFDSFSTDRTLDLAREAGAEVTVGLGARSADQLMLGWRFQELGCRVMVATDDGAGGLQGTAMDAVAGELGSRWPDGVYACGPEPMLRALANRCGELELPCWLSMEADMKCGIGVCGSCHCGDRLVCQDGPVFPAEEMREAWELGLAAKA